LALYYWNPSPFDEEKEIAIELTCTQYPKRILTMSMSVKRIWELLQYRKRYNRWDP
jgi:hypothetical protein